jgi:hypothetical protein
MFYAPTRGEASEDSWGFGRGKTLLSTFTPRIMIPMVKKVPPIPTKVTVTPKDTLSMKISFQPGELVIVSQVMSLGIFRHEFQD